MELTDVNNQSNDMVSMSAITLGSQFMISRRIYLKYRKVSDKTFELDQKCFSYVTR